MRRAQAESRIAGHRKRLPLLLAASLLACVLVASGDSNSTPSEVERETPRLEPPRELPAEELRWLSPRPGERLTGTVELAWDAPEIPLDTLEIWFDGRRLTQTNPADRRRVVNTRFLNEGEHTFELRATDTTGRSLVARVGVVVHNPDFGILSIPRPKPVANGGELRLEVRTRGKGFEPTVDLSPLDSRFAPEDVRWSSAGGGLLQLSYRLSQDNQRPDGSYLLRVRLLDAAGSGIEESSSVRVTLRNYPPRRLDRPPVDIRCAVFRPEPLPASAEGMVTLERVVGPASAGVGEPLTLRLQWSSPPPPEERFLRVSIDGVEGYFALHGTCGLRDEIPLVARRASGEEPFRIAFWPGKGLPAVYTLRVTG
jgi:hypothetical protein